MNKKTSTPVDDGKGDIPLAEDDPAVLSTAEQRPWTPLTDAQIAEITSEINGFRLKYADVQALAKSVEFVTVGGTTTTLCIIVTHAGHVEVGKAACVDPAVFNVEVGRTIAYRDAVNKLYEKEGYLARIAFVSREQFLSLKSSIDEAAGTPGS